MRFGKTGIEGKRNIVVGAAAKYGIGPAKNQEQKQ